LLIETTGYHGYQQTFQDSSQTALNVTLICVFHTLSDATTAQQWDRVLRHPSNGSQLTGKPAED
jgi:hypothetical protein